MIRAPVGYWVNLRGLVPRANPIHYEKETNRGL
jgi:hypothetical protein